MGGGVEKGDDSSLNGSMSSQTYYKHNGSKSLMNYNYRDDMDMNANLQNVDGSSGIGLLNNHTLPPHNESSNLDETNIGVENGDVNGGHCYINSTT